MDNVTWTTLLAQEAAAAEQAAHGDGSVFWALVSESTGVVLLVLLTLVAASVVCWFIIGYKWLALLRASRESREFAEVFWASKRLDEIYDRAQRLKNSPVSQVFQAGYVELRKLKGNSGEGTMSAQLDGIENIERSLRRAMATEVSQLERLIPFLATVGSTAPFVGLFGTVWGIMLAFVNLSAASDAEAFGIDIVAGPIAEALIATAIGLMAAIPAVVAYNFFNARIHSLSVDMENFSNDFLNIVKRHFFK